MSVAKRSKLQRVLKDSAVLLGLSHLQAFALNPKQVALPFEHTVNVTSDTKRAISVKFSSILYRSRDLWHHQLGYSGMLEKVTVRRLSPPVPHSPFSCLKPAHSWFLRSRDQAFVDTSVARANGFLPCTLWKRESKPVTSINLACFLFLSKILQVSNIWVKQLQNPIFGRAYVENEEESIDKILSLNQIRRQKHKTFVSVRSKCYAFAN